MCWVVTFTKQNVKKRVAVGVFWNWLKCKVHGNTKTCFRIFETKKKKGTPCIWSPQSHTWTSHFPGHPIETRNVASGHFRKALHEALTPVTSIPAKCFASSDIANLHQKMSFQSWHLAFLHHRTLFSCILPCPHYMLIHDPVCCLQPRQSSKHAQPGPCGGDENANNTDSNQPWDKRSKKTQDFVLITRKQNRAMLLALILKLQ